MPRLQKIIKGHKYQVGRFAGSWYVADLDRNRFIYGPFLRRETAEARIRKMVQRSHRNPKTKFKIGDSVLIKRHKLVGTIKKLIPREHSLVVGNVYEVQTAKGILYVQEKGLAKVNPEWKPPFAKRKRKRLGELYSKAFHQFERENPKHLKCRVCGKGTIHFVHGKPIHKACYAKLSQVKTLKPNPRGGVLIYGRVLKIFARKTSGPYKGQDFVHTFKPGAIMVGMPDGSLRISHPK